MSLRSLVQRFSDREQVSASSGQAIRVLLVDDDEEDALLTRSLLARADTEYEFQWVGSYGEGLAAILRNEHDAYLIDHELGFRTGVELVREARLAGSLAPLVMLTGMRDRATDLAALEAGASDFLQKGRTEPALLDRTLRYAISHAVALAAIERSRLQINAIEEIGAAILDDGAEPVVLDKIADVIAEQFGLPFVAIYVAVGEFLELAASRGYPAPVDSLPAGDVMIQRIARARSGLLVPAFSGQPGSAPIRTEFSLPVFAGGELAALLNVGSPTDAPIGELDRAAINVVAGRLAAAFELRHERDEARRQRLGRASLRQAPLAGGAFAAEGAPAFELIVRQTVALLGCAPGMIGTAVRFAQANADLSVGGSRPDDVLPQLELAGPLVRLPDNSMAFVVATPLEEPSAILARLFPDDRPAHGEMIAAHAPVRSNDEPSTIVAALDAAFAMAQRAASLGEM